MPGVIFRMTAKKQNTLQEIEERINSINEILPLSKHEQTVNDVAIWTITYEKFYIRSSSYSSLTLVLTEHEEEQTAYGITTGGGDGILNFSYGANRKFAEECLKQMETCGFIETISDTESSPEGFMEKFLD